MTSLCLGLFAATFTFPGGSAAELAKLVGEAVSRPVVVMESDTPKLRKAAFPLDTPSDATSAMASYFSLIATPGEALGFGPREWPAFLLRPAADSPRRAAGSVTWKGEGENRVVTIETPKDGAFSLAAFSRIDPSRPLQAPWYLAEVPLAVYAKDAPYADVLAAVASAVGAELVPEGAGYRLKAIPHMFHQRLNKGWTLLARNAPTGTLRTQAALAANIVAGMSDDKLMELYESVSGVSTVQARRNTPLYNLAWDFARSYVGEMGDKRSAEAATMKKVIDPAQPVDVVYLVRGGVTVGLRDSKGQVAYRLTPTLTEESK